MDELEVAGQVAVTYGVVHLLKTKLPGLWEPLPRKVQMALVALVAGAVSGAWGAATGVDWRTAANHGAASFGLSVASFIFAKPEQTEPPGLR